MAKKRVSTRGRTWVAFILLGFVLVAASVIHRRTTGISQALEIKQLQQELQAIQSRTRKLESDIAIAGGLARIGQIAEQKLGMRAPQETQLVTIPKQPR